MQYYPELKSCIDKGVRILALLCQAVGRADEDFDVAVGAGVAGGVAAE